MGVPRGAAAPERALARSVDITVTDPEAEKHKPAAHHMPEATAERAKHEKNTRYLQ